MLYIDGQRAELAGLSLVLAWPSRLRSCPSLALLLRAGLDRAPSSKGRIDRSTSALFPSSNQLFFIPTKTYQLILNFLRTLLKPIIF